MKEIYRVCLAYEQYHAAIMQGIVDILGWQNKVSPEHEADIKRTQAKVNRIRNRYMALEDCPECDGTGHFSTGYEDVYDCSYCRGTGKRRRYERQNTDSKTTPTDT